MVSRLTCVSTFLRAAWPLAAAVGLGACGASASPRAEHAKAEAKPDALARLQEASDAQAVRVAELEARIALLEADARSFRQQEPIPAKPAETVRIGNRSRRDEAETASVPLVRLHEDAPEPPAPLVLPDRPPSVSARLPVVPLPEQRAAKLLGEGKAGSGEEATREQYRVALGLVRAGDFERARDALTAFLDAHPSHALSDGATYWLGEALYAQRRYDQALRQFEAVLTVFPNSSKRSDSLLKAGLCKKRLGDEASARRYFEQLRQQFPSSDAARVASREGSS